MPGLVAGITTRMRQRERRKGSARRSFWSPAWAFEIRVVLFDVRLGKSRQACSERQIRLEPVQDLVGPEPLEPVQRLVQRRELVVGDAADLFHRPDVLLIER